MGEIAEMHLCGILCEQCGAFVGEDVGYPRSCEDCSGGPDKKHAGTKKRGKRKKRLDP